MDSITLENFIAEIETTFQNYTDSNDLDRISIKGWVIDRLRMFGKNICDTRETVVGIKGSKALLPENFKSLILALQINPNYNSNTQDRFKEIPFKKYITHDVTWDSISHEYIKDNCQSQEVVEKLLIDREPISRYLEVTPLSLIKGIQKNTLDVDCYNLHPSIRNNYSHQINITNRALNTNFKEGLVYMKYNSLPSDEDNEIVIPIITTGHIKEYIENYVCIKIATNLILNNKNPTGVAQLLPMWMQQNGKLELEARSESNWSGMKLGWQQEVYKKNRENQNRYNLPK